MLPSKDFTNYTSRGGPIEVRVRPGCDTTPAYDEPPCAFLARWPGSALSRFSRNSINFTTALPHRVGNPFITRRFKLGEAPLRRRGSRPVGIGPPTTPPSTTDDRHRGWPKSGPLVGGQEAIRTVKL